MSTAAVNEMEFESAEAAVLPLHRRIVEFVRRNPNLSLGLLMVAIIIFVAIFAPWIAAKDPAELNVVTGRLKPPSEEYWFGSDRFGRDVFARAIFGGRISLTVGITVAALAVFIGLMVGLLSGYVRQIDAWLMRIMDGLMAIPGLLLAIGFIALLPAGIETVIIALTIPEIPRVARLVRGVVVVTREITYVEAAVAAGAGTARVIFKHIMPNTFAPLIVQATFVCASAMLSEAALSFLGAGTPPEIPSWGTMMADGRSYLSSATWIILFPGLFLAATVLSVNLIGDGLRDLLDPRFAKEV